MPSAGYVIDAAGITKLREDHEILRKRIRSLEQKITGNLSGGTRRDREFVKVTEQIGQRVTTTLGSGKAEIYTMAKDADTGEVTFSQLTAVSGADNELLPVEVDVYNSSFVPVPEDAYIRISRNFRSGLWLVDELQTAVAKAGASGVTARSGTTAGYGDVSIYSIVDGELEDMEETVTVYSMSSTAVANNAYITIKRCSLDEEWIVDAEDCG